MSDRIIRIGNAGGYWGDDVGAIGRQLLGGPLDAISIDFLAEVTMSIMQKQRARDASAGYARDFLTACIPLLPEIARRGTRIITNAGGVNPVECARLLGAAARERGLSIPIAVVDGDDLMGRLDELARCEGGLACMDTGQPFSDIAGRVASANAYFGALPVARALAEGAQIVITGRVTDTGITLAPMMNAFGWSTTDHDLLAAGIVAGHIIECGAQCTGGNICDWETVPDFAHIGYPVVEAHPDGSFVVTKHPGTGGRVSIESVREQLVYEMGDPGAYLTPDVVADFTTIRMAPDGEDRVRIHGIKGGPPTKYLKVSMSYHAGYKASGTLIISGPRALAKARAFAALFWERLGFTPEDHLTEMVGHDSCHGPVTFADDPQNARPSTARGDAGDAAGACDSRDPEKFGNSRATGSGGSRAATGKARARHVLADGAGTDPSEILLRLSIRDRDKARLETFAKLVPAVILAGPPGVSVLGGKPSVSETIAYWPTLVPRELVVPRVAFVSELEPRHFTVPYDVPCAALDTWKQPGPTQVATKALRPAATPPETPAGGRAGTERGSAGAPGANGTGSASDRDAKARGADATGKARGTSPARPAAGAAWVRVPLSAVAYARSGDKGDASNIGLIARSTEIFEHVRSSVTAQAVKDWFGPLVKGRVTRYEVPNLDALNFLMDEALGGGGTLSLRVDPQGKTLAQGLLRMTIDVPVSLLTAAGLDVPASARPSREPDAGAGAAPRRAGPARQATPAPARRLGARAGRTRPAKHPVRAKAGRSTRTRPVGAGKPLPGRPSRAKPGHARTPVAGRSGAAQPGRPGRAKPRNDGISAAGRSHEAKPGRGRSGSVARRSRQILARKRMPGSAKSRGGQGR